MSEPAAHSGPDVELHVSLDGSVSFSQNPMMPPGPAEPSGGDTYQHSTTDGPASSPSPALGHVGRALGWVARELVQSLPRTFYRPEGRKLPVAPPRLALAIFVSELAAVAAVFAAMCWYFRTSPTQQTTITLAPLPGQTCSVLNPRRDTTFYSAEHSENAQFASP